MEPREYVVGLPVVITVHDDGKVEYEIDTSEASSALEDAWWEADVSVLPPTTTFYADQMFVELDHRQRHDIPPKP